jgi:hypothetical protein
MLVFIGILIGLSISTPASAGLPFLKLFIPHTHPDCEAGMPTTHANFCPSFKKSASCACTSSGMPKSFCGDMKALHKRMLMVFDTQKNACTYQRDVSVKECMDGWNCYLNGGKNSDGSPCQRTGRRCEA